MPQPQASIRTCQIITVALIVGLLFFGAIAVYHVADSPVNRNENTITMVALGVIAVTLLARRIVLSKIDDRTIHRIARHETTASSLPEFLQGYQTRTIVGMALLEGPGFIAGVAYMIEGRWIAMAAMGFQILIMLAAFPTEGKFRRWDEGAQSFEDFCRLEDFGDKHQ